jgi:hypothetical protein
MLCSRNSLNVQKQLTGKKWKTADRCVLVLSIKFTEILQLTKVNSILQLISFSPASFEEGKFTQASSSPANRLPSTRSQNLGSELFKLQLIIFTLEAPLTTLQCSSPHEANVTLISFAVSHNILKTGFLLPLTPIPPPT